MPCGEYSMLGQLHSGTSCSVLVVSSVLVNQQYTLNKVSLNRNMHKARSWINYLTKML